MIHPLHPTSPQYAELVAAGRVRDVESQTCTSSLACGTCHEAEADDSACARTIVALVSRADGAGVTRAVCRSHALELQKVEWLSVRWATECSSCGESAKHYELDSSGRCDECRP